MNKCRPINTSLGQLENEINLVFFQSLHMCFHDFQTLKKPVLRHTKWDIWHNELLFSWMYISELNLLECYIYKGNCSDVKEAHSYIAKFSIKTHYNSICNSNKGLIQKKTGLFGRLKMFIGSTNWTNEWNCCSHQH